jgi:hypothetical protein
MDWRFHIMVHLENHCATPSDPSFGLTLFIGFRSGKLQLDGKILKTGKVEREGPPLRDNEATDAIRR